MSESLDVFVRMYTSLPGTLFLQECTNDSDRMAWYGAMSTALGETRNSIQAPVLRRLRRQLEDCMSSSRELSLPVEGVQPICDPDRTRTMYELIRGTYVFRTHIDALIEKAGDTLAAEQARYMKEEILLTFPPGGLDTECIDELMTLFMTYIQS